MANKVRQKLAATIADYQFVFSTPEGRRVYYDLLKHCGFWRTSFVREDSHATSFNEGARSVLVYINGKTKVDLKRLEELQREGESNDIRGPSD